MIGYLRLDQFLYHLTVIKRNAHIGTLLYSCAQGAVPGRKIRFNSLCALHQLDKSNITLYLLSFLLGRKRQYQFVEHWRMLAITKES